MPTPPSYSTTIQHYERLATVYDRRWQRYNEQILTAALETFRFSGAERLLDVGCGTGEFERLAAMRFPRLTMVGIDVTPAMVARAQQKLAEFPQVRFQVAQAESLPFALEEFDAVVCANTLHHVRRPTQVLQECIRVLRPGGQFVLVDWCRDFWHCRLLHYWWRLTDRSYVRMYRLHEATRLVEALGLTLDGTRRFTAPRGYGMMQINAAKIVCAPT